MQPLVQFKVAPKMIILELNWVVMVFCRFNCTIRIRYGQRLEIIGLTARLIQARTEIDKCAFELGYYGFLPVKLRD